MASAQAFIQITTQGAEHAAFQVWYFLLVPINPLIHVLSAGDG